MTEKRDRVLIIDDEEPVRRTLHQELSGENYLCQKVSSADQALIAVEGSTMGLVIPDIKMLGRSGMELLLEIRAGYPGTAVIMATCIYDASTVVQCMKQGAYDYATKPFDLDEVVLSVRRTLEKRILELENREYPQRLGQKIEEQTDKIRTSFLKTVAALAYALEAKDKYTSGHSQRVAETPVAVARELGMPDVGTIRLNGSCRLLKSQRHWNGNE